MLGGRILTHGIPVVHHRIEGVDARLSGVAAAIASNLIDWVLGVLAGAVVLLAVSLINRLRG